MRLDDFAALNERQRTLIEGGAKPEKVFFNPRNAAAGVVRQPDARNAATRHLRFFAHALGDVQGWPVPATQRAPPDARRAVRRAARPTRTALRGARPARAGGRRSGRRG